MITELEVHNASSYCYHPPISTPKIVVNSKPRPSTTSRTSPSTMKTFSPVPPTGGTSPSHPGLVFDDPRSTSPSSQLSSSSPTLQFAPPPLSSSPSSSQQVPFFQPYDPPNILFHAFRERQQARELASSSWGGFSNGSVSPTRYVPRAIYKGGGLLVSKDIGTQAAASPARGGWRWGRRG